VGFADIAAGIPMRPNAEFWIASMSKAMTASAVMMLVDEGKVKLDDPVEKYLPEFKGQQVRSNHPADYKSPGVYSGPTVPAKHPITLREVLCHTAGLKATSAKEHGALDKLPLADAVRSYAEEPLMYQPGTDYSYANEGINIAGRIVEVVSGLPYETFMQQRLFDPLGMVDTTFWPNADQIKRLAKSYKTAPDGKSMTETPITQLSLPLDDHKHRYPMPAGGLFSTAADTVKFMQMLLDQGTFQGRKILTPTAVKEMTTEQNKGMGKTHYGLGIQTPGKPPYLTVHHGGAYKTYMSENTTTGAILVYMIQVNDKLPDENETHVSLEKQANAIVAATKP